MTDLVPCSCGKINLLPGMQAVWADGLNHTEDACRPEGSGGYTTPATLPDILTDFAARFDDIETRLSAVADHLIVIGERVEALGGGS